MQLFHTFTRYSVIVASFASVVSALPVADISPAPASSAKIVPVLSSELVLVDLNLGRDFGVDDSSVKSVLYELIGPDDDLRSALESYRVAVAEQDLASAILSIFKLAAMKTNLGELVEDVTKDKVYYEKFISDDLVQAVASPTESSNVRDFNGSDKFQSIVFNAFLSANTTNDDDPLASQ